jgi:hypothetical protein
MEAVCVPMAKIKLSVQFLSTFLVIYLMLVVGMFLVLLDYMSAGCFPTGSKLTTKYEWPGVSLVQVVESWHIVAVLTPVVILLVSLSALTF